MTDPLYGTYRVRDINVYANRDTGSIDDRRPFPQLNGFRSWVRTELDRRRKQWPTPISAPFVRMTSCNEDPENKYSFFSLGLHGYENQDTNIFDATYGATRDIVGYAYRDGRKTLIGSNEISYVPPNTQAYKDLPADNPQRQAINARVDAAQTQQSGVPTKGAHPIPGITSVQVRRSGLANPFQVEVHWQCYNQRQLEFLRNHFMIIGSYIVVEWGHKFSDKTQSNPKYLDFSSKDRPVTTELLNSIIQGRKFIIDNYSKENQGNYDFIVGQVGNFNIDFDPQNNIYKCSTRIVSMGENMWGIGLSQTATVLASDEEDATKVNRSVDVHSYFEPGGGYDKLLSNLENESDGRKFTRPIMPPYHGNTKDARETYNTGTNPMDNKFISWTAFTDDLMNDIITMFDGVAIAGDTKEAQAARSMYDRLRNDLRALLGLGGQPSPTLGQEVYEVQDKLYQQEWVGNHPLLRSIDPNTMIVMTSEVQKWADPSWASGGTFGTVEEGAPAPGPYAGKLTRGVWLNTEMIRTSFLNAMTLQQAIQTILSKMNVAVANYWQLQLYYDDEIGVYKVIDYKFDHETTKIPMYVFNSNTNAHHNEVVDIKFDTAFPPELITQMMVVSMIQTSDPNKQEELFKQYPLINNTSPFMFAINWTSLKDILKSEITTKRASMNTAVSTTHTKIVGHGDQPTEALGLAELARMGHHQHLGIQMGNSPQDVSQEGTPRTAEGSPKTTASQPIGEIAPVPNSTAFPPVPATDFRIDAFPVNYPTVMPEITSNTGDRTPPTAGASAQHRGVDLRAAQGSKVFAAQSGVITSSGIGRGGVGFIAIQHNPQYATRYLHLSGFKVRVGERVSAGQDIGFSGGAKGTWGAGPSTGPHLHFEVLRNGVPQKPELYLNDLRDRRSNASSFVHKTPPQIGTASDDVSQSATSTTKTPTTSTSAEPTNEEKLIEKNKSEYVQKFGDNIKDLVWFTPSQLRNKITSDGYKNMSDNLVNAFISPFPTKTSVEVKIPGIAGLSISDAFMVDKLPFIFANYGAFQTTEITETVNTSGWYTGVRGYFKMLWPAGNGGLRVD